MNKEIWKRIEVIYDKAVNVEQKDREKLVQSLTVDEPEIYSQVMNMLKSIDETFMEKYPGLISETIDKANQELSSICHFKIIKKVATGGMGRVYLAQSMQSDVTIFVALKTIRVELINKELEKKFQNEKQILARLKHKNIASLVDAGISKDKIPYIATEWVDGKNLINHCHSTQLDIKPRLMLFQQVCSAVSFAHNKLVIHRDLKPDNILVDSNNQVKLLDFGIAKIIGDNHTTKTQTQIYTPDYAAPEQINGELCTLVTDVYSLGVVLFELLTEKKRFNLVGLSVAEKIQSICNPKAIDLKLIQTKLPYAKSQINSTLITIINKAMHVDPNRRYESASAMSEDVENYLSHRPIKAMKDSLIYKIKMFVLRNRVASFLSTVVLITLLIGFYTNNKQIKLKLREAEKTQITVEFFKDMLKQASPSQGGKTNLTVRRMFEFGVDKYDLDSIKDPYIKAELAAQIGQIYGDLDSFDAMLKYTNIAIFYYKNNLHDDENANTYLNLANRVTYTYMRMSEYEKAGGYLNIALQTVESFNLKAKNLARSYIYYGEIYIDRDNNKSMEYLNKAEDLALAHQVNSEIAYANYNKFSLFYDTNSSQEAEKYLDNAQLYFEKDNQTKFNPGLMQTLSARADWLSKNGKLSQAETIYDKVNHLFIETFGNPDYVSTSNRINNFNKMGDFAACLKYLKITDKIFADNKLTKNLDYYYLQYMKAITFIEVKEYDKGLVYLSEVNNYYTKILPKNHKILSIIKMRYAEFYLKSDKQDKVLRMKTEIDEFLKGDLSNALRRMALVNLANFSLYWGNYVDADNYFSQAVILLNKEKANQEYYYWQVMTGMTLAKVKLGSIAHLEQFYQNKQKLLDKVTHNDWYNSFYSID